MDVSFALHCTDYIFFCYPAGNSPSASSVGQRRPGPLSATQGYNNSGGQVRQFAQTTFATNSTFVLPTFIFVELGNYDPKI